MKLQVPFIQLPVAFDAAALAQEIARIGAERWRAHPSGLPGNSALTLITAHGDPDSDALDGPMQPTPALLECPYLMQVLHALGATWGRSRLMRLSGQAEVTPHVDLNYYWRERMRVHVPITTTPSVRFQCGDAETHMAAGECWLFDTWRMHRVLNEGSDERIHLVADTVGGEGFWDLVAGGRAPGGATRHWAPTLRQSQPGLRPALDLETVNLPTVMSPWEIREHIVFLLSDAAPHPNLAAVQQALLLFSRRWQALWACHGEREDGWPRYRRLLEMTRAELATRGSEQIGLRNETGFMDSLRAHVLDVALADAHAGGAQADLHGSRPEPQNLPLTTPRRPPGDAVFERPVFVVSPPRSGSTLVFETLSRAPGVYTIGDESHHLIERVPGLAPSQRGYDSNRLLAQDADPATATALRSRFLAALHDRDGAGPDAGSRLRMLEKTPKNALRIPFLKKVFPEARFVYLHRDPRQVLASMIEGWNSGHFEMYPNLPDWQGPAWSFLLTPGWRDLSGKPLDEIVARQWEATTKTLLDDLEGLDGADWTALDHARFLADPQAETTRLCEWAGWAWDGELGGRELPLSRYTLTPPDPDKWHRHAAVIEPWLQKMEATVARAARMARAAR